ncbi:MAG: NusG domain II-containing protein [Clostridia bacterium]|nr:NusG domain II-containing protein [Clostridia bacterium]
MKKNNEGKKKIIGRTDILILVSLVAVSVVALVLFGIMFNARGKTVVVTVDGEEYATLSLDEDTVLEVKTERGYNLVVVEDGKVYVKESDCPDKICVKSGEATELKTVVCLPHRLTVSINNK